MRGTDTTFVEKLRIIEKGKRVYYEADVPENEGAVLFLFTQLNDDSFVCENPDHDFPKTIAYQRAGGGLKVQVSGNGESIIFEFVKKK